MKFFKAKGINALFFSKIDNEKCEIFSLYETIGVKKRTVFTSLFNHYNTFLLNDWYKNLSEFLEKTENKGSNLNKIIVFANKDEEFPVLLAVNNQYIESNWFDRELKKNLLIMFTPGGDRILKTKKWAETFKQWVSFGENFDFMNGLPVLKEEQSIIFPKFCTAILNTNDPKKLKEKFSSIIEEAKTRIPKKQGSNDDILALAYVLDINQLNIEHS